MKERTKNAYKKLAQITCQKCETCPTGGLQYRCCDTMFCAAVESDLTSQGIMIEKPNIGGLPYMGENGCVVAPELRPYCTGFVCTEQFKDRSFRREYDRTIDKIRQDPDAPLMPDIFKGIE